MALYISMGRSMCYGTGCDAQFVELPGDEGRRVVLPEREFGMCVQVAAEFDGCHMVLFFVLVCQKSVRTICWMLFVRLIV